MTTSFATYIRGVIGDRFGRVLAEIEPWWGPISWRLNDVGLASFQIAASDAKATATNLRYGNRLYIEFDNGLPPWGGVIDTPRFWRNGVITVNAYSAEYMLSWRRTPKALSFNGVSAGRIFSDLVLAANLAEDLGISFDFVWDGGEPLTTSFNYARILNAVRDTLCKELSQYDFHLDPDLTNGRISFEASFYEQRGRARPNAVLVEAHNVSDEALDEYGTLTNDWAVAGGGVGWGVDRLTAEIKDENLVATYGLRQDSAVYGDLIVQDTIDAQAKTLLANSKNPVNLISLSAQNLAPATFADYDIGDRVRVMLHSHGFDGTDATVRVTTREYNPQTGLCALVLEEVL